MKKSLISLLLYLKCLIRTGWMQRGIPPAVAESVAEHSFESAIIAFELSNFLKKYGERINENRAAVIALFHDLPEAYIGDIPKWTSLRMKNKKELENFAIRKFDKEIRKLLEEYNSLSSLEAEVAYISDKLSTLFQARYYYKIGFKEVREIEISSKREIRIVIKKNKKLSKLKTILKPFLR